MRVLPQLLADDYLDELIAHWRGYPEFWLSSDGGAPTGPVVACSVRPARRVVEGGTGSRFAGMNDRRDAGRNFHRTGGLHASSDDSPELLAARTDYFRATYASAHHIYAPELIRILRQPRLARAARELFSAQLIHPSLVYANVMLPGQELGVHTDVPEFRGAHRSRYPMWLLTVMHHSGLFERWRVRVATAVLHIGRAGGGDFVYFPDGPTEPPAVQRTEHNQALLLDTDSLFHGVDRVAGDETLLRQVRAGLRLRFDRDRWRLHRDGVEVADCGPDDVRYSISWKAQCFTDRAEVLTWRDGTDELDFDTVMGTLQAALAEHGRTVPPDDDELSHVLIDTFVPFPG